MLYKITWDTISIPGFNKTVTEDEVVPFVKALSDLGFTAEVTIVEE